MFVIIYLIFAGLQSDCSAIVEFKMSRDFTIALALKQVSTPNHIGINGCRHCHFHMRHSFVVKISPSLLSLLL